jgi:hypothetical protein
MNRRQTKKAYKKRTGHNPVSAKQIKKAAREFVNQPGVIESILRFEAKQIILEISANVEESLHEIAMNLARKQGYTLSTEK